LRPALFKHVAVSALALASTVLLTSCGTTGSSSRPIASRQLPAYEPPMARADLQTVRTTAYTHTEDDHLTYGARNALGGTLRSAIAQNETHDLPAELPEFDLDADDNLTIALSAREKKAAQAKKKSRAKAAKTAKKEKRARESKLAKKNNKKEKRGKFARFRKPQPRIGSAAADWSRWPVGTTFKVLSTGQVYKIDDIGWALAGATRSTSTWRPRAT
jgi:hypothetical protein